LVDTSDKFKAVSGVVSEYEQKTKDIGLVFKEDQRKEMKSIETQLNTIYMEYEKIEKEMIEIKTEKVTKDKTMDDFLENINNDWEVKYGELSKQTVDQAELITKTDSKISAIIDQSNTLMVNDVKQEEAISSLDKSIKNLDSKLSNLESADLFLQESHRQITEKTTSLEVQENLNSLYKKQQEQIEVELKKQISELHTSVIEVVTEHDSLNKDIVLVKTQVEKSGEKVDKLEQTSLDIKDTVMAKVTEFEKKTKSDIAGLNSNTERNQSSLLEMKKEIQDNLISIKDIEKTVNDKFENVKTAGDTFDISLKTLEDDNKQAKEMLVSLQFQAEKAQYVETLASQVNQMDEVRQKSEAQANDKFDVLAKANSEEINKLKIDFFDTLANLQDELKEEKELTMSEKERINSKVQEITDESKTHGVKLSELEPFAQGVNTKVAELENKIQERISLLISKSEENRSLIEMSTSSMSIVSEKIVAYEKDQKNMSENFIKNSSEEFETFKQEIDSKVFNLNLKTDKHTNQFENIETNISHMNEDNEKIKEEIMQQKNESINRLENLKKDLENENGLIVTKLSEQNKSVETISMTLEQQFEKMAAVQNTELKLLELVNESKIAFTELEGKVMRLDQFGTEQNSLILAVEKTVSEKMDDVSCEARESTSAMKEEILTIKKNMSNDKENLLTLVVEIYSSLRGYTLVVKSEGAVSEHQSDVLGVYRMVDSYNDRPVYKQDGGENYIYYSAASFSWLVGTVVGHQYGWLKNSSSAASSARWLPDLSSGWEYRPLVRGQDSLTSWNSDDGTLRIESLRDVEKVTELIRDIKNSAEVD